MTFHQKKPLETSKKVLWLVLIFCAIYLVAILIGWMFFDRMDAAGLAGVIGTPAVITIGFYSWKAKNENMRKYGPENTKNFDGTDQDIMAG